jgi:hypothetical protein
MGFYREENLTKDLPNTSTTPYHFSLAFTQYEDIKKVIKAISGRTYINKTHFGAP